MTPTAPENQSACFGFEKAKESLEKAKYYSAYELLALENEETQDNIEMHGHSLDEAIDLYYEGLEAFMASKRL